VRHSEKRESLNLVVAGHVDHGKSTILGRLLAETGAVPETKIAAVREKCRRNAKPFEYAFLLDALKDEQAQGITIDAARVFFKTGKRDYLIFDAPGHIEFLKNMITGASWAGAAFLVIDAQEGVRENSRRHGYLLSFLGVAQIVVLVNKMDLVDFSQAEFERIRAEYTGYLNLVNIRPMGFIPVCGASGDNISERSRRIPWYTGPTVLSQMEAFQVAQLADDLPLRIPVQDVYKFTSHGDQRRIIAGRIETGRLSVGDELVFYPSGKRSSVKTIEGFNRGRRIRRQSSGCSTGLTLRDELYIKRGEIAARANENPPSVSSRFRARLFWLGKHSLSEDKKYTFKLGTARCPMRIDTIERVFDAATLKNKRMKAIRRHDFAECVIQLDTLAAFDLHDQIQDTSRFVIVDDFEIRGGGVIIEALDDNTRFMYDDVVKRDQKWEVIDISEEMRAENYHQMACMVVISGSPRDDHRKLIAKHLTERLFHQGRFVYFIGMANLLYGVDADIRDLGQEVRPEHMRRLAEVANMMMHAGLITVVSAREISESDLRILRLGLGDRAERLVTVWAGSRPTTDLNPDLAFRERELDKAVEQISRLLESRGYIPVDTPDSFDK
jgi:bifunctional enzyme CysN/CysC